MEGILFSEPPKSPPTAELLKENLAREKAGKSIFKKDHKRINEEGKRVAASVFSSVLSEGRSAEDVRVGINEVRDELKTSLAARKKELRGQIQTELAGQGLKQKGKSAEFRALVREQLASQIAEDSTVRSIGETRKLLSSINQRARLHAAREELLKISQPSVAVEDKLAPPLFQKIELVKGEALEGLETNVDNRAGVLQSRVDQRLDKERASTKANTRRLNWKGPISRLARPAVAALLAWTLHGSVNFNQAPAVADGPAFPPQMVRAVDSSFTLVQPIAVLEQESALASATIGQEEPVQVTESSIETGDQFASTQEDLNEIAKEYKKQNVEVGISVRNVKTGEQILSVNPNRLDAAASTAKVYTAAAMLDAVAKGDVLLDEKIGANTVQELLRLMVNRSDNAAWEKLDRRLGKKRVEDFARIHGAEHFNIDNNTTTPDDLAEFLRNLYNGEVIPDEQKDLMLSWMEAGTTSREDLLTPSMTGNQLFHKWGLFGTVVADVGIVTMNGQTYTIAVVAGGKSFMNQNSAVADSKGMQIRVEAIRNAAELLARSLSGGPVLSQTAA